MAQAPEQTSEETRLAALDAFKILDTPAEPGFDDVVELAAQICEVPVALVSLVAGDRQWFKARLGFESCETDLNRSVCRHALVEPDLLVIPDLTLDARTADNPLVTHPPHIRFYAGAPLRTKDGYALGSLCVIDNKPRPGGLTADQAEGLRRLARQVMSLMEYRRLLAEHQETLVEQQGTVTQQAALLDTQDAVSLARGDLDRVLAALISGAMRAIPQAEGAVIETLEGEELEYRAVQGTLTEHARLRLPLNDSLAGRCCLTGTAIRVDDVLVGPQVKPHLAKMLRMRSCILVPVVRAGTVLGVLKLQSSKTAAFDDRDLQVARLFAGTASSGFAEISAEAARQARWASESRYRAVFDSAIDYAIVVMDLEGRITNWNQGASRVLGWTAEETVGRSASMFFTDEDQSGGALTREMRDALTHRSGADERWHLRKDGRRFWASGEMMALRNELGEAVGFVKILRDRTDARQADVFRAALLAIGEYARDVDTVATLTRAASKIVGEALEVSRVGFGRLVDNDQAMEVEPDWTADGAVSIAGRHRFADYGNLLNELLRGELLVVKDVRTDPRTAANPDPALRFGVNSFVNIPVRERGKTVAVFIVHHDKARVWTPETLAFLRNVADRVEAGVARIRAEVEQRILNQELSHRLKNTMAMVQAIASQTLKSIPDRGPVRAFERRLHTLSTAHDVLLQTSWSSAHMGTMVRAVLNSFDQPERFDLTGPEIDLGSRAALSLSLLLHELTTNAIKYGALSSESGRVAVAWRTEPRDNEAEIILDWTESGGPPAREPKRKGFGSRLIRMGLVGTGGVDLRYAETGFAAEFRAPLSQVQLS